MSAFAAQMQQEQAITDLALGMCPDLKDAGFGLMATFNDRAKRVREQALAAGVSEEDIQSAEDISLTTFFAGAREIVRGLAKIHASCDGNPEAFTELAEKALAGVEIEIAAGKREAFARTMEAVLGL